MLVRAFEVFGYVETLGRVPFVASEPLNGIIAHLRSASAGRDCGVTVTGNARSLCLAARNVLDPSRACFSSVNEPSQSLCFEFRSYRVAPFAYTVRSGRQYHMKSWVIEASNDGVTWKSIDGRENNSDLNERYRAASFEIARIGEPSRMVRIRQIGKNHANNDILEVSGFDVFGDTTALTEEPGVTEVRLRRSDPLNGIISRLGRKCTSTVDAGGLVVANGLRIYPNQYDASNAVDLFSKVPFCSYRSCNQALTLEFTCCSISATGYTLVSGCRCWPRSWVVEVSNDGMDWKEIDRRENEEALLGDDNEASFEIGTYEGMYRRIRVRQIGVNGSCSDTLMIQAFEVFGRTDRPI